MVVHHVVLFSIKDGADVDELNRLVAVCRKNIPGVIELTWGRHAPMYEGYLERNDGVTHALYGSYISKEALRAYNFHPDHVALVTALKKVVTRPVRAVDWEAKGQWDAHL